ncbi:MAG: cysteine desulfurase [Calditrichaeota bacterium]|nr:cysteine desulfurase [Calditrichota bacterium]
MSNPIYLDYNATTPVDPEVAAVMLPYLQEHFGNPSSSHPYGRRTKAALETARGQVAALLQCRPEEIVFTSGGSESNNYAIKGAAFANRARGNHIITSAVEHPAVTEVCRYLARQGFTVTYLPVDADGRVSPEMLVAAIRPETTLVSIMHANNEVGAIQPIESIASITRARNILLHCDAAQSVGKIPVEVPRLGVDLLSVAGHKLYAPKGVGALYIRKGIQLEQLIHGANHESNRRAGTENVLLNVGLGKACEIAGRDLKRNMAHLQVMRDRLFEGLRREAGAIRLNGHPRERLPNTLSIGFENIEANRLIAQMPHLAVSAGAACHADAVTVSQTLAAMQVPLSAAMGTIRFSTGKYTTAEEIDAALQIIISAVQALR